MYDEPPIQEEEAPSEPTRLTARLVPWVLMVGIALLFFPLTLISTAIDETNIQQGTQSAELQATITAPPPVPREEQTLTSQLLERRTALGAIENVPATMVAAHVDLPAIMAALRSYNANRIRLTAFNHPANRLTLDGAAMEERDVLTYISRAGSDRLIRPRQPPIDHRQPGRAADAGLSGDAEQGRAADRTLHAVHLHALD